MLSKEQKTVISVIGAIIFTVLSVCVYGFTIGGEYLSFSYIAYCLLTAFVMTSFAFLFIFGKKIPKKLLFKELYVIIILVVTALQLLMYQPLNLLTAVDEGMEYEVEITDTDRYGATYFTDREETPRKITYNRVILSDDELIPTEGGIMIIREITGGFNCKHFEIVKVTYEPEIIF